jgi:hypothetical protein
MNPIELTYFDKCDVYELEKTKVKSVTKQDWVLKHQGIECALSKNKLPRSAQTESEHQVVGDFTMFMSDLIKIRPGSKIICKGYDLRSGKSFIYEGSHQEIPVYFEERT